MDMVVGTEYYSKRGWAPERRFSLQGPGLDHFTARWNALFDRGVEQLQTSGPQAGQTILVNQGGADIVAVGRYDLTPETRAAVNAEYLSSYVYKPGVQRQLPAGRQFPGAQHHSLTHTHNGFVPSAYLERLQNFASSDRGDEVRILHLPSLRFDVLDRPLRHISALLENGFVHQLPRPLRVRIFTSAIWAASISIPTCRCRSSAGGWSMVPEVALRETLYTGSQIPDLTGANSGTPTVSHDPLNRG